MKRVCYAINEEMSFRLQDFAQQEMGNMILEIVVI